MTISTEATLTTTHQKRRWFQFSLRTLMILVASIAILAASIIRYRDQQLELIQREKEAVLEIEKLGGEVWYSQQPIPTLRLMPQWLQSVFGIEDHIRVEVILFEPTHMTFRKFPRTDLELLALFNDKNMQHVQHFSELQWIALGGTQVTDEGLRYLTHLTKLQHISLCETKITDVGLEHLKQLSDLEYLELHDCPQITDAGVAKFKAALPNCRILR